MSHFSVVSFDCYPDSFRPSGKTAVRTSCSYESRGEAEKSLEMHLASPLVNTPTGPETVEYYKKQGIWSSEIALVAKLGGFTHVCGWTLLQIVESDA